MPASSEQGASQMDKFKFIVRPITTTGEPYLHVNTLLGSGTFGNVYKARIREDKKALAHNLVPTQDVIVKKTLICKRKNLNDAYPASSLKRYQGIPVWSSRRRDNVEMKLVSNGTSNRLIQGTILTGPITNLREVQKSIELGDEINWEEILVEEKKLREGNCPGDSTISRSSTHSEETHIRSVDSTRKDLNIPHPDIEQEEIKATCKKIAPVSDRKGSSLPIAPQFWGSYFVLDDREESDPDSESEDEGWGHNGEKLRKWREKQGLQNQLYSDEHPNSERPSRAYIHLVTLGELFGGDLMSCVVSNPTIFADSHQLVLREVTRQCFLLLSELHSKGLMHRDIKLSNVLVKWIPWSSQSNIPPLVSKDKVNSDLCLRTVCPRGYPILRLCDMGSCRKFVADKSLEAASNGKYSLVRDGNEGKQRNCDESSTPSYRVHDSTSSRTAPWMGYASSGHEMGPATPFVTSRYYRAPELLCGSTEYDGAVDVWSMATSIVELFLLVPSLLYEEHQKRLAMKRGRGFQVTAHSKMRRRRYRINNDTDSASSRKDGEKYIVQWTREWDLDSPDDLNLSEDSGDTPSPDEAKSDEFKVAAKRPAVLPPFALPFSAKNPGSRHLQVTNCMSRCSNDSSITTSNTICSLLCSEPYAVYAKEYEEALQYKAPAPDTMSRRRVALFPGDSSDAHQLLAIMNILGTPTQEDILAMKLPPFSYEAFTDLVHLAEEIHLMNYWMNHQRSQRKNNSDQELEIFHHTIPEGQQNRLRIPRIPLETLLTGLWVPIDVCKTLEKALKWNPFERANASDIAFSLSPSL